MVIISFINIKGGVAKTISAVNVAAELGKKGKSVLVIDLDPQANATKNLNCYDPESLSTYEMLKGENVDEIKNLLIEHRTPKIMILSKYIKSKFFTKEVLFDGEVFNITLSGFCKANKITIFAKDIKKANELIIDNKKIIAKLAYEISPDCFIWFWDMEE